MAIIGILSLVGVLAYSSNTRTARDAKRKADLEILRSALEMYRSNDPNSQYPTTGSAWWGACSSYGSHVNDYIPGLAPDYIQQLPHDPRESKPGKGIPPCANPGWNCYLYKSNGINYKLLAHCTPENTWTENDPYYDPVRPCHAWQVSSSLIIRGSGGSVATCTGVASAASGPW